MSYLEMFLIAIGLSFDTIAVALVGGACLKCINSWKRLKICLFFAGFQAGFALLGWALGSTVSQYIEKYDHWVAFALLAYIGGKMAFDAFRKQGGGEKVDLLSTKQLIISSIATSIDALAVGISFAMLNLSYGRLTWAIVIIGVVTAIFAEAGLLGGERLGKVFGKWTNLVGGIILLSIGAKILIEHTLF